MIKRTAVITGGLTGIGLSSALALQAAGCKIAVGSRQGNQGKASENARRKLGGEAYVGKLDVSIQESVDQFMAKVKEKLGPPTILVNSHGIYYEAEIADHSDGAWFEQLDINLSGVFRMVRAAFPDMIAEGHGRIVNISSTAGHVGAAKYSAYCASKAGVIGLSKAIAVEGAPHNITCVSISPTWIDTPMMDRATERHAGAKGISKTDARKNLEGSNPQGRIVQPEEVGNLVAFCCSDATPALTNDDIQVNAGAVW